MTTEGIRIDLNVTKTPVSLRDNCSVYNPCGRYGYCRNNKTYGWTCICKFWWNGTYCNELSNGGIQVITLGVMLGILIILFHGLSIYRSIRKKRRLPKTEPKQTNTKQSSFIPTIVLNPSHRIFAWITGILTLILTTVTLIAKWLILKPIHEDIVNKYKNDEPLFFKQHSICRTIDLTSEFNIFTFPFACLLIILFIIITKRVSFLQRRFCNGYFGIPIPLDYFAHVKRTLAAVIFAIFADELLDIALQIIGGEKPETNRGIIVTYIFQIFKVLIIGCRRYPILAAVYINNYFSLICATLYIWFDFSTNILYTGLCRNDFYPSNINFNKTRGIMAHLYLSYYGTGSTLIFFQLFTDIPRYVCLSYICVKLPILLVKQIQQRKIIDKRLTREQKMLLYSSLPHSAESQYIKKLLGMNTDMSTNRFRKFFRFIYTWRDDFRFSSRVVCVYASLSLLLFFLTIQFCVRGPPILAEIRAEAQLAADLISLVVNRNDPELQESEDPSAGFRVPDLIRAYLFACLTALFITGGQLLVMLAGIRRNTLQAFRGDDCEIPRHTPSQNLSCITGNFHFAGYLIGYVILSYAFVGIFALVIGLVFDAFITYGSVETLEKILKWLIPLCLFVYFKMYLNKFLGQYIFLQHHAEVLSINNRRAYMVFIYFNFFLDAFLGVVAAFLRILKSIFGGIAYMCRLDYSPLGRKLEKMDAGFNAYCGFIYMDCAHRHPVLLCFASHLLRGYLYPSRTSRISRAKHKWHLAAFLINNPTLVYQRKKFLSKLEVDEIRMIILGKQKNIQQSTILTHRASTISTIDLEELREIRRF